MSLSPRWAIVQCPLCGYRADGNLLFHLKDVHKLPIHEEYSPQTGSHWSCACGFRGVTREIYAHVVDCMVAVMSRGDA